MPNYVGRNNPFRNKSNAFFEAWFHHIRVGHFKFAGEMFKLGKLVKAKEMIWDYTNELSKPFKEKK